MINLQMRDVFYFAKVAELQHLGQAAQALHITQPALSKCIDRLEELYGTVLFEHVGRGIRLTDAGRTLYERAVVLERTLDETHRQITSLGRGLSGTVRVGAAATVAEFMIPAVCRQLQREAPDVVVNLQIGMNDVLREALGKDLLDILVGPVDTAHQNLEVIPIAEDSVVVAASPSHPLAQGAATLQAMSEQSWVLAAPSVATRQWLERVFEQHGLPPPRVAVATNSIAGVSALIDQTHLLSFISRRNLVAEQDRHARHGGLVEIHNETTTMPRTLGISYRAGAQLSPAARRFMDIMKSQAPESGTQGNS